MQRLSGLDALFLSLETTSSHMHVTGVYLLEPGPGGLSFDSVRERVRSRLPLAAPFRRRLVEVPFRLGHPMWVEDAGFDLDFHLRRASLPSPGGMDELADFVAQVNGQPLDRGRPLWEMYVVEGLEGGRYALVGKMHHAAIDGVSGSEIMASLLDIEPEPAEQLAVDTWRPDDTPNEVDLLALALASAVLHPVRAARTAKRAIDTVVQVADYNRQEGTTPPPSPFSAPKTSLNAAITPHRRVSFGAHPLDDLKTVKNHFSCTVNDVVLAVCAGALRRYLLAHDDLPEDPLVAMVPMSVRSTDGSDAFGNRVTGMLTSLATELESPAARLAAIAECMRRAKAQEELIGAKTLSDWAEFAFPALMGRAARLTASMRVFDRLRPIYNVTVSNVPGPPFPLFLAGARMVGMYPVGPVTEGIGLNITVMSYCGMVYFGLNACRETVPDLQVFPSLLQESLDELVLATGHTGRRRRREAALDPAGAVGAGAVGAGAVGASAVGAAAVGAGGVEGSVGEATSGEERAGGAPAG